MADATIPVQVLRMTQAELLAECATITRRACLELIDIIDAGDFGTASAATQLQWIHTLAGRRETIKAHILTLHGVFPDRSGDPGCPR